MHVIFNIDQIHNLLNEHKMLNFAYIVTEKCILFVHGQEMPPRSNWTNQKEIRYNFFFMKNKTFCGDIIIFLYRYESQNSLYLQRPRVYFSFYSIPKKKSLKTPLKEEKMNTYSLW